MNKMPVETTVWITVSTPILSSLDRFRIVMIQSVVSNCKKGTQSCILFIFHDVCVNDDLLRANYNSKQRTETQRKTFVRHGLKHWRRIA